MVRTPPTMSGGLGGGRRDGCNGTASFACVELVVVWSVRKFGVEWRQSTSSNRGASRWLSPTQNDVPGRGPASAQSSVLNVRLGASIWVSPQPFRGKYPIQAWVLGRTGPRFIWTRSVFRHFASFVRGVGGEHGARCTGRCRSGRWGVVALVRRHLLLDSTQNGAGDVVLALAAGALAKGDQGRRGPGHIDDHALDVGGIRNANAVSGLVDLEQGRQARGPGRRAPRLTTAFRSSRSAAARTAKTVLVPGRSLQAGASVHRPG